MMSMERREFLKITLISGIAFSTGLVNSVTAEIKKEDRIMPYAAKDYSKLIGMEGFSETLLKNHFTLYQGYVTNTNKVLDTLDQMLKDGKTGTPEFAELKRRLGWEFNGMRADYIEAFFKNINWNAAEASLK